MAPSSFESPLVAGTPPFWTLHCSGSRLNCLLPTSQFTRNGEQTEEITLNPLPLSGRKSVWNNQEGLERRAWLLNCHLTVNCLMSIGIKWTDLYPINTLGLRRKKTISFSQIVLHRLLPVCSSRQLADIFLELILRLHSELPPPPPPLALLGKMGLQLLTLAFFHALETHLGQWLLQIPAEAHC